jgi:CBS domain-containing protein
MNAFSLDRFDQMPLVGAVMTPFPHFVRPEDSIASIHELMERFDIHHIPLQRGTALVGVISETELAKQGKARRAADLDLPPPYIVGIGARLSDVVREMSERHLGSVLVVRHEKLAGILSVTDACRLLAEALEACFDADAWSAA